jgi:hypothetical protein
LHIYHKEIYKLAVRSKIAGMTASEANAANIRKKLSAGMPVIPFYQEFVEEVIKEDYSKDGPSLRESVLKALKAGEDKPKAAKPKVDYKAILLDGIQSIGVSSSVLSECAKKIDENEVVLESRKKSFWEKFRLLMRAMMKSEPEELVFELQCIDQATGTHKTENLYFYQFRADMDKRIKILNGMSPQGTVMNKLKAMPEDQVTAYLEKTIRDIQNYHRTLTSLDEYFKSSVPAHDRARIRGIKPELASIKNCLIRANQFRHEYIAQKEEEEQMKRLGININQ